MPPKRTPKIYRVGRGKTPNSEMSGQAGIVLKLLLNREWMSGEVLQHALREYCSPLQAVIEHLRDKGGKRNVKYNITSRKVGENKYEFSLILTEEQLLALPVEINDCGKITMIRGLK